MTRGVETTFDPSYKKKKKKEEEKEEEKEENGRYG